ncbi:hypothetical protein QP096_07500 [Alloscardovia omnicolens]|nr:hypothetical protein [Alloscardovia omnicolens]MDK6251834.1 hypothetical protein [Alloscardovia omnicolens]MDK8073220.1 hypothetical protein [Alloscardovia omnicolens]
MTKKVVNEQVSKPKKQRLPMRNGLFGFLLLLFAHYLPLFCMLV